MEQDFNVIISRMENSLRGKVKARGIEYATENDIKDEIRSAIFALNERRRFDATPSIPFEPKYETLIVRLALASITKYGAEGETGHSENGISRSYDTAGQYPEALMSMIIPLAKAR